MLAEYVRDRRRARAQGTALGIARALDVFLRWLRARQPTGTLMPELLTRSLLADYYDATATGLHDRPRRLETRRRLVQAVERFWAWAWEHDLYGARVPRPRRLELPSQPRDATIAPTWDEMDRCLLAAQGWHRQLAVVLRCTGLRVQQAMGLRWDDLDLRNALLRVRGDLGKSRWERAGRIVPVSRHLVAEVQTWDRVDAWLVPCCRRPGPREREARGRDMARAWRRTGVREEVWRQRPDHAFRRGVISGLIALGAHREAVEYLVGHSQGIRGLYTDPSALPLRQAVELVPALPVAGTVLRLVEEGTP